MECDMLRANTIAIPQGVQLKPTLTPVQSSNPANKYSAVTKKLNLYRNHLTREGIDIFSLHLTSGFPPVPVVMHFCPVL